MHLFGGETVNHVNCILYSSCYFKLSRGRYRKNVNNYNPLKTSLLWFYLISTCKPIQNLFQVDIEINEDKFGQLGDRILYSHITVYVISCRHFLPQYIPFTDGRSERQQSVSILSFVKYGRLIYSQRQFIDCNTLRKNGFNEFPTCILFAQLNLLSKIEGLDGV